MSAPRPGPHRPPSDCPVCGDQLLLTRLGCPSCGTELSGRFETCKYCRLGPDDREILAVFLTSRGNMKELERFLGVSYPTTRTRFDAVLGRLGLSPAASDSPGRSRLEILEALARGELDIDDAQRLLAASPTT